MKTVYDDLSNYESFVVQKASRYRITVWHFINAGDSEGALKEAYKVLSEEDIDPEKAWEDYNEELINPKPWGN